jgi:hypothetical protein
LKVADDFETRRKEITESRETQTLYKNKPGITYFYGFLKPDDQEAFLFNEILSFIFSLPLGYCHHPGTGSIAYHCRTEQL